MTAASDATSAFSIRFHGVRGSLPVSGLGHARFGGATLCIEVQVAGRILFFDAGSGILPRGKQMKADGVTRCDIFLSHWHYDHVMGLPFFAPFYNPAAEIGLWSGHAAIGPGRDLLAGLMREPYFPVGPEVFNAAITYHDFSPPETLIPAPGLILRTHALPHPGGATAYRLEYGGRSLALVTDVEHVPGQLDTALADFVRGVDLMLYDSAFEDSEMSCYCGFGHSSWQQALRVAEVAGVARVGFVHHAPMRHDPDLERIERAAQARLPGAFAACEGQVTFL